jgi:signal transduction histidine kinase
VVDLLLPQTQGKNISLHVDIPEKLSVLMDKNLIERVFINLINNAIKFTPQNGVITIRCTQNDERALISILDTGLGIPKHDLENIFQEFYRVDDPKHKEVKGSGLGLSLVKRIIETHKERIWVESEVGKGTMFTFTLRIAGNV